MQPTETEQQSGLSTLELGGIISKAATFIMFDDDYLKAANMEAAFDVSDDMRRMLTDEYRARRKMRNEALEELRRAVHAAQGIHDAEPVIQEEQS